MFMATRSYDYYINDALFRVQYGSITELAVDVLVSSDDTSLTMSSGVSAAIRRIGGEQIFNEAQQLTPLKVGEVVYTSAGHLKAEYVFHPGIITRRARGIVNAKAIGLVTRNCLLLAEELGVTSIAFPAIGTGNANVPFKEVAQAMLQEITSALKEGSKLQMVILALYNREGVSMEDVNQWYEYMVAQLVIQGQQKKALHQLGDIEVFLKKLGDSTALAALGEVRRTIKPIEDVSQSAAITKAERAATDLAEQLTELPANLTVAQNATLLQQFQKTRLSWMHHLLNLRTLSASKKKRVPRADKDAHEKLEKEIAAFESQLFQFETENSLILTKMAKETSRDIMEGNTKATNQGVAPAQKNYLFVIGINDYKGFNRLNNAVKDAQDFISVMQTRYGYSPARTHTLFNSEATRENIYAKLEELTGLSEDDNLLIYFSGHGFYDKKLDQGYWIPVDAQPKKAFGFLENSSLNPYIKALPCRHVLIIADACFSGALLKSDRSTASDRLSWTKSRWAIVSGRLEEVSDGGPGGNSPFATYLINYLKKADSAFATDDLSAYIVKAVGNNANQLPQGAPLRNVGDDGGLLYFYPDGKGWGEMPMQPPSNPVGGTSRGSAQAPAPPQDLSNLSPFQQARKLILADQLGRALELINDTNQNPQYSNTLIQLLSRFNRLNNQALQGILTAEQQNIQTAQITNAVLQILDKMEKGDYV